MLTQFDLVINVEDEWVDLWQQTLPNKSVLWKTNFEPERQNGWSSIDEQCLNVQTMEMSLENIMEELGKIHWSQPSNPIQVMEDKDSLTTRMVEQYDMIQPESTNLNGLSIPSASLQTALQEITFKGMDPKIEEGTWYKE